MNSLVPPLSPLYPFQMKVFMYFTYPFSFNPPNLEIFLKKVNSFYPKTISAKSSTLDVWKGPKNSNTYFYESYSRDC